MRRLPVVLRETTGRRHFLGDCDVRVAEGAVEQIEYEGHRYLFSHVSAIGGHRETIYAFREATDTAKS